jgi:hypothetical protein
LDVIKKTYRNEGFNGFYKGVIPSMIRGLPSKGFYFMIYEIMKNKFIN